MTQRVYVYFKRDEPGVIGWYTPKKISPITAWLYRLEDRPAYAILITPKEGYRWVS